MLTMSNINQKIPSGNSRKSFLASPDALEVMLVTESVSVSIDLSDVTLVSDDTY